MAGFNEASDYCKILVFLLGGNLFVHVVSYGSPYWTTRMDGNAGLWTGCTDGLCYERWNQWVAGWIKMSQTCMTLTFITLTFSTTLVLLYVFQKSFDKDKRCIAMSLLLMVLSSVFTFMAVVTWTGGEHLSSGEALNWGYVLAWVSSLCSLASVPLLYKEITSENFFDNDMHRKDLEAAAASRREKEGMDFNYGPLGAGQSLGQLPYTPTGTLNPGLNYSRDFS